MMTMAKRRTDGGSSLAQHLVAHRADGLAHVLLLIDTNLSSARIVVTYVTCAILPIFPGISYPDSFAVQSG